MSLTFWNLISITHVSIPPIQVPEAASESLHAQVSGSDATVARSCSLGTLLCVSVRNECDGMSLTVKLILSLS